MLNFKDFSATQILREINFVILKSQKTAILTTVATLNFEFLGTFNYFKCEIFPKLKIQSLQNY